MILSAKGCKTPELIPGVPSLRKRLLGGLAGLTAMLIASASAHAAVTYVGDAIITGTGTDSSGLPSTVLEDLVSPQNALNGFGSGLAYAGDNVYYALSDRGPNKVAYAGGAPVDNTTSYANRYQQLKINLVPVGSPDGNGHYASYTLQVTPVGTTLLKNSQGVQYTGLSTGFSSNPAVENHRLDSEGIRVAPDGTTWISDEYGPYILHFNRQGQQIGSLQLPAGFQVATPAATGAAETASNTTGRTNNRGAEGVALTPDGKTMVVIMQSSLTQDGGLNGINVRFLVYDLTNQNLAPKQYLYQLDSKATPLSEILAINNHEFLIDERDGVLGAAGIKKLYKIDLNQATPPTDLATSGFPGTTSDNGMPATGTPVGVVPLQKTLFADIGQILTSASPSPFSNINGTDGLPDKIEGYAWGPDLADGRHLLLATNDNDYARQGTLAGFPNYIFAFAVDNTDANVQQPVFLPEAIKSIDHIIVIYQENWPFDGLYSSFPGANGIANASATNADALIQLNKISGNALSTETGAGNYNDQSNTIVINNPPAPLNSAGNALDSHFLNPDNSTKINTLVPYLLTDSALGLGIDPTYITGDIYHRYWQEQSQINGGKMNLFVNWSDNPGLVMSRFDATNLPEGLLAQQYTMCDNFFHSAFGGSFLNHQFLVAAQAPVYPGAPSGIQSTVDPTTGALSLNGSGKLVNDQKITAIGTPSIASYLHGDSPVLTYDKNYAVNTIYSINLTPNGTNAILGTSVMPSINDSNSSNPNYYQNIGDLLSQANVSWKWYSGGWNTILQYTYSNPSHGSTSAFNAVNPTLQIQWHHQPFAYFDNYAPFGTALVPATVAGGATNVTQAQNAAAHLQDEMNFFSDVTNNTLPAVSFIKAVGVNNEHPGYAALQVGQNHVASIVQAVQANPALWAHTAIVITYDEHGGRWDHAAVPYRDIWGPGARVPCIVISPYAQKGYVDHTQRDTSAILATIEDRFNLDSLNQRDLGASNLFDSFSTTDVIRGVLALNRRTGGFTQTVTVTNRGSVPVAGPIQLALDNLPGTTDLTNKSGVTATNAPAGSPYITASGADLAAGASATVTLQFSTPTSGGITYRPRVVNGTANP